MALSIISLTLMLSTFATTIHSLPGAGAGITIDLIPLHSTTNTSSNHFDNLYASFRRSIARAARVTSTSTSPSLVGAGAGAQVSPIGGEYVVELGIGTPPTKFIGIVDTGSDLIWSQCKPCIQCFTQQTPIFDPSRSSTYKTQPCNGNGCSSLPSAGQGCNKKNTCTFLYGYGDKSSVSGELATETITLGASRASSKISNIVLGCGHNNKGTFQPPATGLVGLGQGPLSFTSQTKNDPEFAGKFAYCLVPLRSKKTSKISFGENAVVSGNDVVSTPVFSGEQDTFYYVTLEGVTVGEETVAFKKSAGVGPDAEQSNEGNIIIDSGTTLTFLPDEFFKEVLSKLKSLINAEEVEDPQGTLQLCYRGDFDVPKIAFNFKGATVDLALENVFIGVVENVACLSMLPAGDTALFGNLAQMNFVVGHDLDAKTVSFKPFDCTKYV